MAIFYSKDPQYKTLLPSNTILVIGDYYHNGTASVSKLTGSTSPTQAGSSTFIVQSPTAANGIPLVAGKTTSGPPVIPKLYPIVNTATLSTFTGSPIGYTPVAVYGGQSLAQGSLNYGTCTVKKIEPSLPDGLSYRLTNAYASVTSFGGATAATGGGFNVLLNVSITSTFTVGTYYRVSGNSSAIYNGNYLCVAFTQGKLTLFYPQALTGTAKQPTPVWGTGNTIVTDNNVQILNCPESTAADTIGVPYFYNFNNFYVYGATATSSPATTYTVTFDDGITTTTATFSLEIVGGNAPIVLTVNQPNTYSLQKKVPFTAFTPVSATGGASYLAFSITPPLPDTLKLNTNNGQISGTTDAVLDPGVTFTVTVRDGGSQHAEGSFSLTVTSTPAIILTLNPAIFATAADTITARIGAVLNSVTPVLATGGVPPFSYSIDATSSPALPLGLSLDGKTGALAGTPNDVKNTTAFTILVKDSSGDGKASLSFNLEVKPKELNTSIKIPTVTLVQKVPVSKIVPTLYIPVIADGGYPPIRYSAVLASDKTSPLPTGLSINPDTGEITGTPSTTLTDSTAFLIIATDSYSPAQVSSKTVAIIIQSLTPLDTTVLTPIPVGTKDVDLTPFRPVSTITASPGYGAIYYSITPTLNSSSSSNTIKGVTFDIATGLISGKPTETKTSSFTVTITDSAGQTSSKSFSFGVYAGPLTAIKSSPGTVQTRGIPFTVVPYIPVTFLGGYGNVTYGISGSPSISSLGLNFYTANGAITGTATSNLLTQTTYTVTLTDEVPTSVSQTFNLTINDPTPITTTKAFASKTVYVGDTFSGSSLIPVSASNNNVSPIRYAVSPYPLVGGLIYSNVSGNITGTVANLNVNTTTTYTVTATDLLSQFATASFDLTVNYRDLTTSLVNSDKTLVANSSIIPFTPVTAAGGYGTITLSIAPTVPSGNLTISALGLNFGSANGSIYGTPNANITTTSYTVTANTAVGQTSSKSFLLTINPPPPPPPINTTLKISNQTLIVGQANVSVIPVTANGGVGTLTFTLDKVLPTALKFTPTGQLLGIPNVTSSSTTYTVIITDQNTPTPTVNNSNQFNLNVINPDAIVPTQVYSANTFVTGVNITPYKPVTATGGYGTLTFKAGNVSTGNSFINGLTFGSDGQVSGTPINYANATVFTVWISDQAGQTVTSSFNLTITPPTLTSTLKITTPPVFTRLVPIIPFTPVTAVGGYGGYSYSISPPLPGNLELNANTGVISNVAVVNSSLTSYTLTVTDVRSQTTSQSFSLTVNEPPALTTSLDHSTVALVRNKDQASVSPVSANGGVGSISFSANISLPLGLSFSTLGKISGIATQSFANAAVLITAKDSLPTSPQTSSQTFYLSVTNPPLVATLTTPTVSISQYKAASFQPVTASGTGVYPYVYTSTTLPTGLSINKDTGYITGTPGIGTSQASTGYTITITDSENQTDSKVFYLEITAPASISTSLVLSNVSLTIGVTISNPIQPVIATGGAGSISYSISPSLPNSLSFSSTTGNITNTPIELHTNSQYTITAIDSIAQASSTQNFYLEVKPVLLTARIVNPSYVFPKYSEITAFAPITPVGGYGTKSYSISPSVSNIGLAFDQNTGFLSGTPTALPVDTEVAKYYTVTITDSTPTTPQTATGTFNITVSAATLPTLTAVLNSNIVKLTQNDIVSVFPVTGSGGYTASGNYRYSISPNALPATLTFNTTTGEISGTADNIADVVTYTVTVTDDAPATAQASFDLSIAAYVTKSTTGFTGSKGYTGSRGYTGSQGDKGGLRYNFNTSTIAISSPPNGDIRYDSNVINTVSHIYISNYVATGVDMSGFLATWSSSTNTVKGQILITDNNNDVALTNLFNVTGVLQGIGFYTLTVTYLSGDLPTSSQNLSVQFTRSGNLGYAGSQGKSYEGTTNLQIITTNTTVATNTTSGALQVAGGASILGNLYVGNNIIANSIVLSNGGLLTGFLNGVLGANTPNTVIATSVTTTNSGQITGYLTGAIGSNVANTGFFTSVTTTNSGQVTGYLTGEIGANVANSGAFTSVTVTDSTDSTGYTSGALKVTGGVGIGANLYVHGNVIIDANLYVRGNTTTLGSQDLTIQDSIINLHTSANLAAWTVNDGKDIGFKFHYYDVDKAGGDNLAFLGRANDTGYLEWYTTGTEDNSNVFTGGTYGTIKTGELSLANTTVSTNSSSGALRVAGGAGIGGSLYVGGNVSAGAIQNTPIGNGQASSGAFTTLSVSGITNFNNNVNITGTIIPTANVTYDLGNATNRFRSIYVDANSVYLGNVKISEVGGDFTVLTGRGETITLQPQPTSLNGTPIGNTNPSTGTFTDLISTGNLSVASNLIANLLTTSNLVSNLITTSNLIANLITTVNGGQITGFLNGPIGANAANTGSFTSLTLNNGNINNVNTFSTNALTANLLTINGNIYANGNVIITGDIIPTANVTYNLGSPQYRFKDLYLSGTTLDLNGTTLSANNGIFVVSALTAINGGQITGYFNGPIGANAANSGAFTSLKVSSQANISNTTNSTSSTSGALIVAGGAGIAGNLYVGGNLFVTGNTTLSYDEIIYRTEYANLIYATTVSANTIGNIGATITGSTGLFSTNLSADNLTISSTSTLNTLYANSVTTTNNGQVIGWLTGAIGSNVANTGFFTSVTTTNSGQVTGYLTGAIGANLANSAVFTTAVANSFTTTNSGQVTGYLTGAIGANLANSAIFTTVRANNYVDFGLIPYVSRPAYQEGRMYYDSDEKTLVLYGDSTDVEIAIGEREWVRCRNNTGAIIPKGTAVYVTGVHIAGHPVHGHHPTVAPADANDPLKKNVIGIAAMDIQTANHGYVVCRGYIHNVDTSMLMSGMDAYLCPDEPGLWCMDAPDYPNFPVKLGTCLTANATIGTIYVNILNQSFDKLRVTGREFIDGDLTVGGNLNITGLSNKVSVKTLEVQDEWVYLGAGDTVTASFSGTGLNDMTFVGHYEGTTTKTFYVKIDNLDPDKFSWSLDNFSTTVATGVAITAGKQLLQDGISVQFVSAMGHTLNDIWSGVAIPKNLDFGIIGNYVDAGKYTHAGLFRDGSDNIFKFFKSYDPEVTANINVFDASFSLGNVQANTFYGDLIGDVTGAIGSKLTYPGAFTTISANDKTTLANTAATALYVTSGIFWNNGNPYAPPTVAAGGASTSIQFNDNGITAGASYLKYISANGNLVSTSITESTSANTGALTVAGGVGIGGNLYVGGNLVVLGTTTIINTEIVNNNEYANVLYATTINASTIGNVGATVTGTTASFATLNANVIGNIGATITGNNATFSNVNVSVKTTLANSLATTLYTTNGIFWESNGAPYSSIGGFNTAIQFNDSNAQGGATYLQYDKSNGNLVSNSTTASTSKTTGAIVTIGGIGIGGNVFANAIYSDFHLYANGAPYAGTYSNANVSSYLPTYTGNITAGNVNVSGQVTGYLNGAIGANTPNTGSFTSITTTGNISGVNYITANIGIFNSTTASTSKTTGAITTLGGIGIGGNIFANAIYSDNHFFANGATITTPAGGANTMVQFNDGSTFSGATYLQYNKTSGNLVSNSTTISTSTTTGALTVAGGVGIGGNLNTASIYTNNYYWANGTVFASSSYGNTNVAAYLLTNTGNISAGNLITNSITTAGTNVDLTIDPNGTGNVVLPINTELIVQSTANSTSTASGAIIVSGGVGVAGNLNASGVYAANVGFVNNSGVRKVYQFYNAATDSLDTVFG